MIKQTYNKLLTGCVSFVKSSCKPSMECFQTCLWSTLGDKPHEFVSFNAIFPYFPERCVVFSFIGLVGLWVITSTCFLSPPNNPLRGDGENAISNLSLFECLCISLWKAVGLFFFEEFWLFNQMIWGFCWGFFCCFLFNRNSVMVRLIWGTGTRDTG